MVELVLLGSRVEYDSLVLSNDQVAAVTQINTFEYWFFSIRIIQQDSNEGARAED